MKRGQEEIAGFVLIVVLLGVVLVIFLGILIRQDNSNFSDSGEILEFLESSFQYTSECSLNYPVYASVGELVEGCLDKRQCGDGVESCDELEKDLKGMIEKSWNFGSESSLKGYSFNSSLYDKSNGSINYKESVLYLSLGNCSGSFRGAEHAIPSDSGTIVSRLVLCG